MCHSKWSPSIRQRIQGPQRLTCIETYQIAYLSPAFVCLTVNPADNKSAHKTCKCLPIDLYFMSMYTWNKDQWQFSHRYKDTPYQMSTMLWLRFQLHIDVLKYFSTKTSSLGVKMGHKKASNIQINAHLPFSGTHGGVDYSGQLD